MNDLNRRMRRVEVAMRLAALARKPRQRPRIIPFGTVEPPGVWAPAPPIRPGQRRIDPRRDHRQTIAEDDQ